jgi:anti-sigma factor RsiW
MTECKLADRLGAYHDGELDEASRAAMEAHRRVCPACAAELARLQKLSQMIGATARPAMSAAALQRLHRSVDLQPRITVMHMAEAFAAVAAAVLIAAVIWLSQLSTASEASAQIPVWEAAAVAPQDTSTAGQEQLALWIVQDLSGKNGQ